MDKILKETLSRLNVIECRLGVIETAILSIMPDMQKQESEPEPIDYEALDRQAQSDRIRGTKL